MHACISDRTDRAETRYELARDVNGSRSDVDLAMLELAEREARAILAETEPEIIGNTGFGLDIPHSRALAEALEAFVGPPCRCAGGSHWSPERGYYHCNGILSERS